VALPLAEPSLLPAQAPSRQYAGPLRG
ncbi:hypothetical protein RBJ06_27950, partial [Pseudomonas aeruginosa]|nr:hypothetical protein [Pseudomonas aeruginosa]